MTIASTPTETKSIPEETEPTEPDLSIHGFEQYQEECFDFPSYLWKLEVNFERQLTQVDPPNSRIEVNAFLTNGELYVVRFTLISNAGSPAETRDEWELHAAKTGESTSYEFLIGSTFSQWISSEYNTEGWAYDPNDRGKILSPDKQYSVKASGIITPKVIADPR